VVSWTAGRGRGDTVGGMSSAPLFGRVLTAMVTPMFPDGRVDLDGAQRLATHLVAHGHDGLIVSGTTGESPTTSDAEKDQLLRAVVEAVGDRSHIVAGVGSNNTAHSVDNAQAAAKAGAHGVLVVTPYYNKPPQEGLLHHFTAVADASELPVMVYDIPGRSGIAIHTETLLRLAEHPRIRAVKDAKGDLFASSQVMARSDLQYYSGDDVLNLAHLTQGAVGIASVVGHVAGPQYAEMVAAVAGGDLPRAIALHRQLIPAVNAVMNITQGAIMAKAALRELGVIASAAVRLPLVEATADQVALVRDGLRQSGLT
jgi:4-hydroxy-tetrahydrodipicolinate synthase